MIIQVTEHDFLNAFQAIRPDNFSRASLKALFEYYEECDQDYSNYGKETELDVIAICCDWTEVNHAEAVQDYAIDFKEDNFVLEVEEDLYLITG